MGGQGRLKPVDIAGANEHIGVAAAVAARTQSRVERRPLHVQQIHSGPLREHLHHGMGQMHPGADRERTDIHAQIIPP